MNKNILFLLFSSLPVVVVVIIDRFGYLFDRRSNLLNFIVNNAYVFSCVLVIMLGVKLARDWHISQGVFNLSVFILFGSVVMSVFPKNKKE